MNPRRPRKNGLNKQIQFWGHQPGSRDIDHELTHPRRVEKLKKIELRGQLLKLGVILLEEFKFRILDVVKPPVDHEIIPLTQNSKNWKKGYGENKLDVDQELTPPTQNRKMKNKMIRTPTWT